MFRAVMFLAATLCAFALGCGDDGGSDGSGVPPPPPPPPVTPTVLFNEDFTNGSIPSWYRGTGIFYTTTFDGTPAPALRLNMDTSVPGTAPGLIYTMDRYQGRNVTYTCNIRYNPSYSAHIQLMDNTGNFRYWIALRSTYIEYIVMNPKVDSVQINVTHDANFHAYKINIDDAGTATMYRDDVLMRTITGLPDKQLCIYLIADSDSWFDSVKVTTP